MKRFPSFPRRPLHAAGAAVAFALIPGITAANHPPPAIVTHPPIRVPGKAIERTAEFSLAAPPEAVFPLLCPVREFEWLPDWQSEMLRSYSGYAEKECVFRTTRADSGVMTWVVTDYAPPRRIGFTCFNTTTDHVMRLRIELAPTDGGGTRLHWRWRWIVTGPKGDSVVDRFSDADHAKLVAGIEDLMRNYLEHGSMPPPEPAAADS